jgi:2-C-methyl-D-erythritol 4-phosphate cytidylyltransferase
MIKCGLVILAGGAGERMGAVGSGSSKTLLPLDETGDSAVLLALQSFALSKLGEESELFEEVVVVARAKEAQIFEKIKERIYFKNYQVTEGGVSRQESVWNGLSKISNDIDVVFVHDGARPFCLPEEIVTIARELMYPVSETGAALTGAGLLKETNNDKIDGVILGRRVSSTLKRVSRVGIIEETVVRDQIWEALTPQAFPREVIIKAHLQAIKDGYLGTDDSQLVERMGGKIKIISTQGPNIKLTESSDLELARAMLPSFKTRRDKKDRPL